METTSHASSATFHRADPHNASERSPFHVPPPPPPPLSSQAHTLTCELGRFGKKGRSFPILLLALHNLC